MVYIGGFFFWFGRFEVVIFEELVGVVGLGKGGEILGVRFRSGRRWYRTRFWVYVVEVRFSEGGRFRLR